MTEVFEGSVIRCMRRLEELLRQMCQAAKAIGNTELENKFAEGEFKCVCVCVCVCVCCYNGVSHSNHESLICHHIASLPVYRYCEDQKRHCFCC